jgi:hypothetical protein
MEQGNSTNSIPLTQEQLDQINTAQRLVTEWPQSPNHFDANNSDHRMFFVSFDGTWNDHTKDGILQTNTSHLQDLVSNTSVVRSSNIPGVGTDGGDFDRYARGGTGDGMIARAERGYKEFKDQVDRWYDINNNAEFHISMAGFSRGSGSERHLANLLYDRGIPHPDAEIIGQRVVR